MNFHKISPNEYGTLLLLGKVHSDVQTDNDSQETGGLTRGRPSHPLTVSPAGSEATCGPAGGRSG